MPVYSAYTRDFSAGSHSFRCVYSIFTCSGAFFFCLFCSRPLCSMSSPSLGCAWNADGSLKPTEEIEWSYSWTPHLFWCSHPRSKTHRSRTEAEPEVSLSTGLQAVLNLDVLISQNYLGRFDSSCLDLQKPRQTLC